MKSPTKPRAKAVRFNLFFLEMIIVLLFFSIAAAVILNVFAASDRLAKKSKLTESMTFCAQSLAEIYSETGNLPQTVDELFGENTSEILCLDMEDGTHLSEISLFLGENCEISPQPSKIFLTLSESAERFDSGTLKTLYIKFEDTYNKELYQITSGAYIPKEWGDDASE